MQATTRVRMGREQREVGTENAAMLDSHQRVTVCGHACPKAMQMHSGQARGGLSSRGVFRAALVLLVVFCSWAPIQAEVRTHMDVIQDCPTNTSLNRGCISLTDIATLREMLTSAQEALGADFARDLVGWASGRS